MVVVQLRDGCFVVVGRMSSSRRIVYDHAVHVELEH